MEKNFTAKHDTKQNHRNIIPFFAVKRNENTVLPN